MNPFLHRMVFLGNEWQETSPGTKTATFVGQLLLECEQVVYLAAGSKLPKKMKLWET